MTSIPCRVVIVLSLALASASCPVASQASGAQGVPLPTTEGLAVRPLAWHPIGSLPTTFSAQLAADLGKTSIDGTSWLRLILGLRPDLIGQNLTHIFTTSNEVYFHPPLVPWLDRAGELTALFSRHIERWLQGGRYDGDEDDHFPKAISTAVKLQLRRLSFTEPSQQSDVSRRVREWAIEKNLRPTVQYFGTHNVVLINPFRLERGADISIEIELIDHSHLFKSRSFDVDAINFSRGVYPDPLSWAKEYFVILLQGQALKDHRRFMFTLEQQVWEVGLHALGYSVDEAREIAMKKALNAPLTELMNYPPNRLFERTSGPFILGSNQMERQRTLEPPLRQAA